MSSSPTNTQVFRGIHGEQVSYAEYGDPRGHPVLFCHGAPGSRFQLTAAMAHTAEIKQVRLIIPDRPGYGDSNYSAGNTVLAWPDSMNNLLASLGIETPGVIGYSMGGMYALACAYSYPDRFRRAALVGSMSPNILHEDVLDNMPASSRQLFTMARDEPAALCKNLAALSETPEHVLALLEAPMPRSDRLLLIRPEINAMFKHDCAESLKSNAAGLANDFILSVKYWGFDLATIKTPVTVWHGTDDSNVPLPAARYLVSQLNIEEHHFLPGEGHLCLFNHWEEILEAVSK